jgi:multiple sugar transport system substrate-binding protein
VEAMQVVVDKFNAKYPQYRMKQNVVGWGEAYSRVTAQVEAGVGVDLQQAIPAFFTAIRQTGGVQPATGIFNKVAKEVKFIGAYVDQYRADGEIWAIPAFGMLELLMYNKKHFEEAGIPHPPKTTEEVLAAAKKLTIPSKGQYGFALPASDTLAGTQSIYTWMGAFGGKKIFDDNCKPIVNNPQNISAYTFLKELAKYSPPDIGSYAWAEVEGALVSGKASMITFKNAFMNSWINDSGLEPHPSRLLSILNH